MPLPLLLPLPLLSPSAPPRWRCGEVRRHRPVVPTPSSPVLLQAVALRQAAAPARLSVPAWFEADVKPQENLLAAANGRRQRPRDGSAAGQEKGFGWGVGGPARGGHPPLE